MRSLANKHHWGLTVNEHTAVKSSCQSDLRHGAINQQVLERTWKQESHDDRVNTVSLLSSESVGLGLEGEGLRGPRSGLPAATGSQSHDLHVSDRQTGGRCNYSSLAFFFLILLMLQIYIDCVSSVSFYVCGFFLKKTKSAAAAAYCFCFCFSNSKPTVPSLYMHVYYMHSSFPREWDVFPACEQSFYWDCFSQCRVGKWKMSKADAMQVWINSWDFILFIFFFAKKSFMTFFYFQRFGRSHSMSKYHRTFKRLSRIKGGAEMEIAWRPLNLNLLQVPEDAQGLAPEDVWITRYMHWGYINLGPIFGLTKHTSQTFYHPCYSKMNSPHLENYPSWCHKGYLS